MERKNSKSNAMKTENKLQTVKLVICISNEGFPASLEVRKIYQSLDDGDYESGQIRVVDESGEDYLYPAAMFVPIDLPKDVHQAVVEAA